MNYHFIFDIVIGASCAALSLCVLVMARRMRRLAADPWVRPEPRVFDFRVLAGDLPESMPIVYTDSDSLYYAAKFGAGGEWYNLLTIGSDAYRIEIRSQIQIPKLKEKR